MANDAGLELSVLNPSFIIGPPRTPRSDGESLRNMKQLLEGHMPHRGLIRIVMQHTAHGGSLIDP